ncbi:MAG: 23S rRNA (uracil(1939)-C(5))-methyltransferase RlmD, partial [Bacteroidota bacterium]
DSSMNGQAGNPQFEIRTSQSEIFLGLHVPQRYDKVLDISECHLQSEVSNTILAFTRKFARRSGLPVYSTESDSGYFRFLVIRQSTRTNELMVNLVTFESKPDVMKQFTDGLLAAAPGVTTVVNTINNRKAQIAFGDRELIYHGEGVIHERIGSHTFTISAGSFFQTNTAQAEKLYTVARDFADIQKTDTVYDLYSGTGSIALFVSDKAEKVIGIESVESAVRDAERNAKQNGVTNCSFVLGDLKDQLTKDTGWMKSHAKPDVLIIDPPRSGMHPRAVEEIVKMGISRIVYVSCNPATQARDLKVLCGERYRIIKIQPVDMFPHTYHIENVVLLHLV